MEEEKRFELEEFIENLEGKKARHTELITVYVPKGYNINTVQKQLEQEKSTASNIKSTSTRRNVIDALESLIRQLKMMKKTPVNGLALFAGNVAEKEGQQDFQVWTLEPPSELNVRLYRCDQTFILDPLKEMLEVSEVYGLVVLDRNEATLGVLEGKNIKTLQHMTSGVPGKTEKGGQCLSPDTLIMMADRKTKTISEVRKGDEVKCMIDVHNYGKSKVTEKWKTNKWGILLITTKNNKKIICSKDHQLFARHEDNLEWWAAEELEEGDELSESLLEVEETRASPIKNIKAINKPSELIDITVESGNFIANGFLVHNSAARFARIREGMTKEFYRRVAEAVKNNFFDMKKLKGLLVGGPGPTKEDFLKEGQIVTALKNKIMAVKDIGYADQHGLELLVETSKDVLAEQEIIKEKKLLEDFFMKLGKQPEKVAYGLQNVNKALDVGAVELLILSKKLGKKEINILREKAKNTAANIEFVSEETEEGQQFKNLGGAGGMLRFAI